MMDIQEGFYGRYMKRPLDFILALLAIIGLSPLIIVVGLLVKVKLGSPVIFKQRRPGLNERIFTMYKFRTMTEERDEHGEPLPDPIRLTPFGKFLRSTSLDELPELINILKGDMSIVGPRPQLVRDMVFMTPEQRRRHFVRPGLTGLAQISGRNGIPWERKLDIDLQYAKDISFFLDCKLVFVTLVKVISREGVSSVNMDTAEDLGDSLLREQKISLEEHKRLLNQAWKLEQVEAVSKSIRG